MAIDISIIIPNNNTLPLLHRMIASIPDEERYQIIVVDNSPTPLSATDIIAQRHNVEVYYSDPQRGAGGARNEGLTHAQGQWLLFADADDFYTPQAFSAIQPHLNSDHDIIYFGWTSCFSDTLQPANRNYVINQYIDHYIKGDDTRLRYYWDSPCSKLVRTALVRQHNVQFEEVPAGNDMGFAVRIGTFARSVAADPTPVYCATILSTSIIHTKSKRNVASRFKSVVRLNTFLKQQGLRQYRHSILRLWLNSWHKGPIFALGLLFYSWRMGNPLFIGYQRWFSTLKILIGQKPKV